MNIIQIERPLWAIMARLFLVFKYWSLAVERTQFLHYAYHMNTITLRLGCVLALLAVALGAFGAHALKPQLLANESLEVWKTAVQYQMWHALALLLFAHIPGRGRACRMIPLCFGLGVLLFSGSLYGLALAGPKWLGPITPLGGLLLMLGWGCALVARLGAAKN